MRFCKACQDGKITGTSSYELLALKQVGSAGQARVRAPFIAEEEEKAW